jgi:hypothetical protein
LRPERASPCNGSTPTTARSTRRSPSATGRRARPEGLPPVSAPPGYDLYYLNVMAGPIREWKFKNDPDHEWLF